jgi:hypothetical protein
MGRSTHADATAETPYQVVAIGQNGDPCYVEAAHESRQKADSHAKSLNRLPLEGIKKFVVVSN